MTPTLEASRQQSNSITSKASIRFGKYTIMATTAPLNHNEVATPVASPQPHLGILHDVCMYTVWRSCQQGWQLHLVSAEDVEACRGCHKWPDLC